MRELHYTFVVKLNQEDEMWESEFENSLMYVLKGVGAIEFGEPDTEFTIDLVVQAADPSEENTDD